MAGGKGTRLKPFTNILPKAFLLEKTNNRDYYDRFSNMVAQI